jgi:1-deoxy-D-xylulose-5-phosphate synthase
MDEGTLARCYEQGIRDFVTIEDHLAQGGFGSLFLETAARLGMNDIRVRIIGIPESKVPDDSRDNMLALYGLDAESLAETTLRFLNRDTRESASG